VAIFRDSSGQLQKAADAIANSSYDRIICASRYAGGIEMAERISKPRMPFSSLLKGILADSDRVK
jgi:hypothetical protein